MSDDKAVKAIEPPTEVTITAGGHTVVVKAAGELKAISDAALALHQATHWDPRVPLGFGSTSTHGDA